MAAQQPTYDQEQAIRDYARLMEAGPLAENEEGLHALIEQAYVRLVDYSGKIRLIMLHKPKFAGRSACSTPITCDANSIRALDPGVGASSLESFSHGMRNELMRRIPWAFGRQRRFLPRLNFCEQSLSSGLCMLCLR